MFSSLVGHFASSAPVTYIAPSVLFKIGGFTITNSMVYGWISIVIMVVLFIWVARRMTVKPKGGLIQFVEVLADFISGTVQDAFDEKERAQKYILYFVTLFCFLLVSNLLGIIPGVGSSIVYHGNPFLRPFTADFNATLAVAAITMGLVYSSSIREVGIKAYLGHFFVGSLKNPFNWFLGLTEMVTDLARVISLSLRLFLNVSIVAIMVDVFAWLGHVVAPLSAAPFFFLDVFDDGLQAFIFVLLGIMYIAIAVNAGAAHNKEHLTDDTSAATMGTKPEVVHGRS